MKQIFGVCARSRRYICLQASGELRSEHRARLQSHLAVCPRCRQYHDDIRGVAGALATWERSFGAVEPRQAVLARWEKDLTDAIELQQSTRESRSYWLLDWCREMVWPYRRIWTGMAAVWLFLFGVNLFERDPARTAAAQSSPPSLEMVRAYLSHEGFVGGPMARAQKPVAAPSGSPAPGPRSEQRRKSAA